jgi:hypothetical protein
MLFQFKDDEVANIDIDRLRPNLGVGVLFTPRPFWASSKACMMRPIPAATVFDTYTC